MKLVFNKFDNKLVAEVGSENYSIKNLQDSLDLMANADKIIPHTLDKMQEYCIGNRLTMIRNPLPGCLLRPSYKLNY